MRVKTVATFVVCMATAIGWGGPTEMPSAPAKIYPIIPGDCWGFLVADDMVALRSDLGKFLYELDLNEVPKDPIGMGMKVGWHFNKEPTAAALVMLNPESVGFSMETFASAVERNQLSRSWLAVFVLLMECEDVSSCFDAWQPRSDGEDYLLTWPGTTNVDGDPFHFYARQWGRYIILATSRESIRAVMTSESSLLDSLGDGPISYLTENALTLCLNFKAMYEPLMRLYGRLLRHQAKGTSLRSSDAEKLNRILSSNLFLEAECGFFSVNVTQDYLRLSPAIFFEEGGRFTRFYDGVVPVEPSNLAWVPIDGFAAGYTDRTDWLQNFVELGGVSMEELLDDFDRMSIKELPFLGRDISALLTTLVSETDVVRYRTDNMPCWTRLIRTTNAARFMQWLQSDGGRCYYGKYRHDDVQQSWQLEIQPCEPEGALRVEHVVPDSVAMDARLKDFARFYIAAVSDKDVVMVAGRHEYLIEAIEHYRHGIDPEQAELFVELTTNDARGKCVAFGVGFLPNIVRGFINVVADPSKRADYHAAFSHIFEDAETPGVYQMSVYPDAFRATTTIPVGIPKVLIKYLTRSKSGKIENADQARNE